MKYFLLAILLGYVLRFLSTVGLSYYIRNTVTQQELESKLGFYVFAILYGLGAIVRTLGIILVTASLIKEHFLT